MEAHNGHQSHQDPGPRTQGIVGYIEPESGQKGMLLVAGREYPLGDVSPAPGLRPGIPGCPPVHGYEDEKCYERHPGRIGIRHERQDGTGAVARRVQFMAPRQKGIHAAAGPHGGRRQGLSPCPLQDKTGTCRSHRTPRAPILSLWRRYELEEYVAHAQGLPPW